jgi:hypothetical protein
VLASGSLLGPELIERGVFIFPGVVSQNDPDVFIALGSPIGNAQSTRTWRWLVVILDSNWNSDFQFGTVLGPLMQDFAVGDAPPDNANRSVLEIVCCEPMPETLKGDQDSFPLQNRLRWLNAREFLARGEGRKPKQVNKSATRDLSNLNLPTVFDKACILFTCFGFLNLVKTQQ